MSTENMADWESSFVKEVEVLRLASSEGNVNFLSIYQKKTFDIAISESASLYQSFSAMDMSTIYGTSDVYHQLREKCKSAIKESELGLTAFAKSIQEGLKSGKIDWEQEIEEQKIASNKRWDDLRRIGIDNIKRLPAASRPAAARTFSAAISIIGKFGGAGTELWRELFQGGQVPHYGLDSADGISYRISISTAEALRNIDSVFAGYDATAGFSVTKSDFGVANAQFIVTDHSSVSEAPLELARQLLNGIVGIISAANIKQ